jgi:hypothetical protein
MERCSEIEHAGTTMSEAECRAAGEELAALQRQSLVALDDLLGAEISISVF